LEQSTLALDGIQEIDWLVAHSLGGLLALQLLSVGELQSKVTLLIGTSFGPKDNADMNAFLRNPLDLATIKQGAGKLYSAFSLDDPWTPAGRIRHAANQTIECRRNLVQRYGALRMQHTTN
jgi:predicted alpha/beta hydrolase family esterase